MKTLFIGTGKMGQSNSLLYWHPILCNLAKSKNNIHLFLSHHFIEKLPSNIRTMPPFKLINFLGFNLPSLKFIIDLIKERPELIITSEFGAISIMASVYTRLNKNTRMIILVENHPKYLSGYGKNRGNKFNFIRSLIANSADTLVTNNASTRNYLTKDLKCSEGKIITAPYLTSVRNSCLTKKQRHLKDHIQIVSIGQIIKRKGFDYLISEIALLPDEIKERIKLRIIGDGEELKNLIELSKKNGLSKIISFTGKVSYNDITKELTDSDMFIMPTLGDYRSLALFEALSAGLPLLGSCYDGSSEEAIIPGENGEIFDPLTPGDLSNKIIKIINGKRIDQYSKASTVIAKKFTVEAAAHTLAEAITRTATARE